LAARAVIDFGPISSTSKIVVNYEPPSAEIIVIKELGRLG